MKDHASSDCTEGSDPNKLLSSGAELREDDLQPRNTQLDEELMNEENVRRNVGKNENDQKLQQTVVACLASGTSIIDENIKLTKTVIAMEELDQLASEKNTNGIGGIVNESDSHSTKRKLDNTTISGGKRPRVISIDQDPSVHVAYNSLTRASKRKLEELLQQWSEWHAEHVSSTKVASDILESGQDTYFPALHVIGQEKASIVSFWMDNQTIKDENGKFIPLDGCFVPLYDRGFSLGSTSLDGSPNMDSVMDKVEASRCFNCGSYSHSLKECPKPRDNIAVNNSRNEHNSKRGVTIGSRNTTRYYQSSNGGKYDGIRAGFLGIETRQLLGITELDPPPWLHRMQEIGYPPGYLDPDLEDQPSGITIFTEEEVIKVEGNDDQEDGEIPGTNNPEPKKRMSVAFPGINAPIPENADELRWSTPQALSGFDSSRNRHQPNRQLEPNSRGHYNGPKRSREDGPPGVDFSMPSDMPRFSGHESNYPSDASSPRPYPIPSRHSAYDPKHISDAHCPRLNPISAPRSGYDPNYMNDSHSPRSLGRFQSDRERRSSLAHEGALNHVSYNSPQGYRSLSYDYRAYGSSHQNPSSDPPLPNDRYEPHRHHNHHHRR